VVQVGLNGVDNGSMRFQGVRVPRENLLDRFASVDRTGAYRSPFSASRRFAATLGELTGGRVGLTCSSLGILKVGPLPAAALEQRKGKDIEKGAGRPGGGRH
jgi:alkylation response protein AidB-like acyl-CoA dehydrogenase